VNGISIATSRRARPGISTISVLVLGLGLAASASGQEVTNVPEIPLTFRTPVAARYAGMGGASIAFADDHTALFSNPATLGLVRSIEFAAGFDRQSGEMKVGFFGTEKTADFGKTRLSHLGFAYPFPTYSGSLVIGFAYGRVCGLDSAYLRQGSAGQGQERESILEDGGLSSYAAGVALEVSPNLTLGITGTILGGSSTRERSNSYDDLSYGEEGYMITDTDFTGITGSLGALLNMGNGLRLGLLLQLPEGIDADVAVDDQFFSSDTLCTYHDHYGVSDRIELPFRLGAGLAFARKYWILAADAVYGDWRQVDYGGLMRTGEGLEAYRETIALRLGGEVLLPTALPLRLRAGYAYEPLPYQVVLTQTAIGCPYAPAEYLVRKPRYEEASFQQDRQYLTFGGGILLAESFTLDVAYMYGGFERTGTESSSTLYREEQTDGRLLFSLSMRLR
jgi:hypothetical protein